MKLLTDLFTTDYGLMSIIGILFMIGMAIFFLWMFMGKMDKSASQTHALPPTGSTGARRP